MTRSRKSRGNKLFLEALESRLLMSYTWNCAVPGDPLYDTGNPATNGTNLQNILNGTTTHGGISLAYGDTLVLAAGVEYRKPITLYYIAGTGTITIESSTVFNATGLPAGHRVSSADASLMAKITTTGSNSPAVKTESFDPLKPNWKPAHDFTFVGIEFTVSNNTSAIADFVRLGDGSSDQNAIPLVPTNFVLDRVYIHATDTATTGYNRGIQANCNFLTVKESEISNIHHFGADAQAISGSNGLGNFTITNNTLEATGENIIFGGAQDFVLDAGGAGTHPTNITITNNYFYKRKSWNEFDRVNTDGFHYDVKNLFELKHAVDVTINGNTFDNLWVGADQTAYAINFGPKNQGGGTPWTVVANVSFTNNVIRYAGGGVQLGMNGKTTQGSYTGQPMHDMTIANNLFEYIQGGAGDGNGTAFLIGCANDLPPGYNVTIDHNTILSTNKLMEMNRGLADGASVTGYFNFTNNIVQYAQYGNLQGNLEGITALNAYANNTVMTNFGSGYTAANTSVQISDPTGTGAAAVVSIVGGQVQGIRFTSGGTGYTNPTITIVGDGTGATATCTVTNGSLTNWTFNRNVMIGVPSAAKAALYPNSGSNLNVYTYADIVGGSTNMLNQDNIGMMDYAGENPSLLATIINPNNNTSINNPLKNWATGGTSDPGVNYANLLAAQNIAADPTSNPFIPIDSTLQGFWKFDDSQTSTTATDSSSYAHNGTLSSTGIRNVFGEINFAIAQNGATGGQVTVSSFNTSASFSFGALINPSATTIDSYIAKTNNSAFLLKVNNANKLVATLSNGATVTDTTALDTTGKWTSVLITWNSATHTLTLYRDGIAVVSDSAHTGALATGSTTLWLGGNSGTSSNSFKGTIDEARYYTSALSSSAANNLYIAYGPQVDSINPSHNAKQNNPTTNLDVYAWSHSKSYYTGSRLPSDTIFFHWTIYSYGPDLGHQTIVNDATPFDHPNGNVTTGADHPIVTWNHGANVYVLKLVVTDMNDKGTSTVVYHPMTVTAAGLPADPDTLTATPGTSNIVLNWIDHATNETGFKVYRSTDNLTWGSPIATIAVANTQTYTDSTAGGANAGTAYYYKVTAYNGAGESGPAFLDSGCFAATVTAYESFNYTVGTGANWAGHNTGLGFTGNWTLTSNTNANVVAGSLVFTNNTHTLTNAANQVNLTSGDVASNTLSTTVGTNNTTLWVGFEYTTTKNTGSLGNVQIGSSTNNITLGMISGHLEGHVLAGGSNFDINTLFVPAINQTYFIACQIQYKSTGDIINVYIDPQPGPDGTPTNYAATATRTLAVANNLSTTTAISLSGLTATNVTSYDELRLGVSYASVAPDPSDAITYPPTASPAFSSRRALATPSSLTLPTPALRALPMQAIAGIPMLPVSTPAADLTTPAAPTSDYHYQGDAESHKKDPQDPDEQSLEDLLL